MHTQAVALPLPANNLSQGSCYTTASWRFHIVLAMLRRCRGLLRDTTLVVELEPLRRLVAPPIAMEDFWEINERLDDRIVDCIRICTCFENVFKAELLRKGYVIHEVHTKGAPASYRPLASAQRKRPVRIAELRRAQGVAGWRRSDFVFEGLNDKTIPFSRLLATPGYRRHLRYKQAVFDALTRFNDWRNGLHFLSPGITPYNAPLIADLDALLSCFDERVVPTYNRLRESANATSRMERMQSVRADA